MTHKSPHVVPEELKKKPEDEFSIIYNHAFNEFYLLKDIWIHYENLFGRNRERVDLLNSTGGSLIYFIQNCFRDAAILSICRLSDGEKTGDKNNLSFERFKHFMDTEERKSRFKKLLCDVDKKTQFARNWRNKRLAHNDFEQITKKADPLEPATQNSMNAAIDALFATLSYLNVEFMGTHLCNDLIRPLPHEMSMLHCLYLGKKWEDEMKNCGKPRTFSLPRWLLCE